MPEATYLWDGRRKVTYNTDDIELIQLHITAITEAPRHELDNPSSPGDWVKWIQEQFDVDKGRAMELYVIAKRLMD